MSPPSALLGHPPANDDDRLIVRAFYVLIGKPDTDTSKGFKSPTPRPPPGQYRRESRGPDILAYCSTCIFIMVLITGMRLALRMRSYKLRFGWDDWVIIPAAVSFRPPQRSERRNMILILDSELVSRSGGTSHDHGFSHTWRRRKTHLRHHLLRICLLQFGK